MVALPQALTRCHTRAVTCLLVSLLACTMGVAVASEFPGYRVSQPIILRLDGAFAADRDAARANGADAVTMRIAGVERWFGVTKARTLGDRVPLGRDVLEALRPTQPNLVAVGSAALVTRLADAGIGVPIQVEGLVSQGGRQFLLRHVVAPAPPP